MRFQRGDLVQQVLEELVAIRQQLHRVRVLALRYWLDPDCRDYFLGFRLARHIPGASAR